MRWIAGVYLLELAYRIATAAPAARDPDRDRAGRGDRSPFSRLRRSSGQSEGVDHRAQRPRHLTTASSGTSLQLVVLLSATFVVVICFSAALWTSLGVTAARFLRTPRALRGFNLLMAALLVASIAMALLGIV